MLVIDFVDNANMFNMPYSLHRVLNIAKYQPMAYVLAPENKRKLDQDMLFKGEKPEASEVARKDWDKPRHIAAVAVPHVADPTGAGDAYRAGMLKALHAGLDMETAAELGAVCASFCIEKYGTQEHTFTKESFAKRYETAYGPLPALPW